MKTVLSIFSLLIATVLAQAAEPVRFETVEVFVDAGERALGAYQVEFWSPTGNAKVVGIEGGEGPFDEPPSYDPRALRREWVILAAFTTQSHRKRGSMRVATVHVQVSGTNAAEFRTKVTTAADTEGAKISAKSTTQRKHEGR